MQPLFNPFHQQVQSNTSTASVPQQVLVSNMLQNSMPVQPQMGLINPQFPFPLGNGQAMPIPGMQSPMITQPTLVNAANPFLFSQNNHLGMPQLGHMSQSGPQNGVVHVPMFPAHGQFYNLPQNPSQGQIFTPNLSNMPQHLNQNMGLPNGQLGLQNQMQNMNGLVAMQMPSTAFFGNSQFGLVQCNGFGQQVQQNRKNLLQPINDANASKPSRTTQQLQGNSCAPIKSEPQLGQSLQPSAFTGSQGNYVGNDKGNASNANWKNVPGKNFTRNPKRGLQGGFQKSQFHHVDNAKRKYGFHNDHKAKGHGNERAKKFGQANHMNQPKEIKRSLALTYTEREIQQWREERRKNYPTTAKVEKRKSEKLSNSDVIDREAKIRREQLKDILAKQAELGVEVAEIPSYYFFDSEKQVHGREENTRPLNKRGRFQNKHDKRGRYNKKDQFAKKQKLADKDSSNTFSFNKRKPTLLQKLLSADIRRDRSRLLQVFRFMVMNSFFKDWPEKPLKFPTVIVKESECAGGVIEDKSLLVDKDVSEHNSRTTTGIVDYVDNDDDDDNSRESQNHSIQAYDDNDIDDDDDDKQLVYLTKGKGSIAEELVRPEEEEGEIID